MTIEEFTTNFNRLILSFPDLLVKYVVSLYVHNLCDDVSDLVKTNSDNPKSLKMAQSTGLPLGINCHNVSLNDTMENPKRVTAHMANVKPLTATTKIIKKGHFKDSQEMHGEINPDVSRTTTEQFTNAPIIQDTWPNIAEQSFLAKTFPKTSTNRTKS
jgi:hypothetical protein